MSEKGKVIRKQAASVVLSPFKNLRSYIQVYGPGIPKMYFFVAWAHFIYMYFSKQQRNAYITLASTYYIVTLAIADSEISNAPASFP